jgi:16S rRNA (uracil1498-N3)-methyltransferase
LRRRFFVERFANGAARLEGESARHLGRVLRAEPGQIYELSDGESIFLARLDRVSSQQIDFSLLESLPASAPRFQTSLLLALVKFDRFEWALEKATELGVDIIVPLAAERSEKAFVAAAAKRAARWQKILLESAQQARCLRVPVLQAAMRPAAAFAQSVAPVRVFLSERAVAPPIQSVFSGAASKSVGAEPLRIDLSVGPEGGWTEREFDAASSAGFLEASLGKNILRTETAVIAALAAVHLYFDA